MTMFSFFSLFESGKCKRFGGPRHFNIDDVHLVARAASEDFITTQGYSIP